MKEFNELCKIVVWVTWGVFLPAAWDAIRKANKW
jgi:hypothetical protein